MAKRLRAVSPEALDWMARYEWPGNVRELENLIERIVTLTPHEYHSFQAISRFHF